MTRNAYTNADLKDLPGFNQMRGPKPPDDFVSNGVTCGPDILFGIDLRPAAHWHDWAYSLAERNEPVLYSDGSEIVVDESFRYVADLNFSLNCMACRLKGFWAWLRGFMYYRLRLWGHKNCSYSRNCEPIRTPSFYMGLFFGRYITFMLLTAILVSSVAAQCTDGSCAFPLPQPARRAIQKAKERRQPEEIPPCIVRVTMRRSNGARNGSGVLIPGNIVVTCNHGQEPGWTPEITFTNGSTVHPTAVYPVPDLDMTLMQLSSTDAAGHRSIQIGTPPGTGDRVFKGGFGGGQYSSRSGKVVGYEGDWLVCSGLGVVHGDSGGPIFTTHDGLVAIIAETRTYDDGTVQVAGCGIRRIMAEVSVFKAKQQPQEAPAKPDPVVITPPPIPQDIPQDTPSQTPDSSDAETGAQYPADSPASEGPGTNTAEQAEPDADLSSSPVDSISPLQENNKAATGGGDGRSVIGSAASALNYPALWTGLAAMFGIGGPLGLGIGVAGWLISKRVKQHAVELITEGTGTTETTETTEDRECGDEFLGQRDITEAEQFLRLAQYEGRNPVLDTLSGRVAMDWLKNTLESESTDNETRGFAERLNRHLHTTVEKMAPLAITNSS